MKITITKDEGGWWASGECYAESDEELLENLESLPDGTKMVLTIPEDAADTGEDDEEEPQLRLDELW